MGSYENFKSAIDPVLDYVGFCSPSTAAKVMGCSRQRVHQIMQTDEFTRDFTYLNKQVIVRHGHVPDLNAVKEKLAEKSPHRHRRNVLAAMLMKVQLPNYPVTSEWVHGQLPANHGYSVSAIARAARSLANAGHLKMLQSPNRHGYIMSNEAWEARLNGNIEIRSNADVVRVYLGGYRRSGGEFHAYEIQKATGVNIAIVYNVFRQLIRLGEVEFVSITKGNGNPKINYRFVSPSAAQPLASPDLREPDHQ